MDRYMILTLLSVFLSTACLGESASNPAVRVGLDNIQSHSRLFENKRLGVITNHTGVDRQGRTTVAALSALPGVRVVALFGPEHGFAGKLEAGLKVPDQNDNTQNIPIYSLYGETRKPTPEMLKDVEVLVFDIQDVGARFYTYLSTMSVSMEAAAEKGIPFVVLDRPNPLAGRTIEGPLLDKKFASFIGLHRIPVRYGLTVGELARLINQAGLAQGRRQGRPDRSPTALLEPYHLVGQDRTDFCSAFAQPADSRRGHCLSGHLPDRRNEPFRRTGHRQTVPSIRHSVGQWRGPDPKAQRTRACGGDLQTGRVQTHFVEMSGTGMSGLRNRDHRP